MIYRIYVKEAGQSDFHCFSGEINSLKWARNIKNLLSKDSKYDSIEIRVEGV